MDITEIVDALDIFYSDVCNDDNARYRSWEYCYRQFYKSRLGCVDENTIDFLCLHLSFYLASWGMYRGSSFLLQKDYKIHRKAVLELMNKDYNPLVDISCTGLSNDENKKLLQNLTIKLQDIYTNIRDDVKGTNIQNAVSDTLVTKILLGTLGCVPAYDRYFVGGIKKYKIASGTFNFKSLDNLIEFYKKHELIFEEKRQSMRIDDEIQYPQMKLIDMAFWQIGYNRENKS